MNRKSLSSWQNEANKAAVCRSKFRPLRRTAAGNSDLCGNVPPQIPTFLKVGALLRSVKRSGINDISAYCDFWRTAAGNSDLCGNVPPQIPTFLKVGALLRLVKRSGINDIPAYCDLWQCAAPNSAFINIRNI